MARSRHQQRLEAVEIRLGGVPHAGEGTGARIRPLEPYRGCHRTPVAFARHGAADPRARRARPVASPRSCGPTQPGGCSASSGGSRTSSATTRCRWCWPARPSARRPTPRCSTWCWRSRRPPPPWPTDPRRPLLFSFVLVPVILSVVSAQDFAQESRLAEERFTIERRAEEVLTQDQLAPQRWAARLAPAGAPRHHGVRGRQGLQGGHRPHGRRLLRRVPRRRRTGSRRSSAT